MTTLYEGAYAKINLTLDVHGKRPDGYHDITSVMQTISIRDDVEVDIGTGKPWEISCQGECAPNDQTNLAWKAAELFFRTLHIDPNGISIRITKRIPAGAGLGGGSADAGAVLRALNRHYQAPLSLPALAELGRELGSDVPFCTLCGTALVEGTGERIRRLPDMPDCIFVVCKPEFSVSTAQLYEKLDETVIGKRPDNGALESGILAGDLGKIAENLYNVFDPIVTAEHLELNYIKSIFNSYGACGQQMTGSGSAVFCIVDSFEYAAVICNMLKENYPKVFIAKPV